MTAPRNTAGLPGVAVVAIGRNEGERLRACLHSVVQSAQCVVYVDSGSTDDSVAMARALGVEVVELPPGVVFTAALARNAGWRRVLELAPQMEYIQFVDGDCAVNADWLYTARDFLANRPDVAAVCGRRRERHPERSIYNLLCDLEWAAPAGETKACGGDVMMRVAPLQAAGGYNPTLIAGEEPKLCVRLRAQGWRVWRLNAEMTLHDAAMTRFSQWWKRSMRAGYTFAEGAHMHGKPPERHRVIESRRTWIWGIVIPSVAVAGALVVSPWALALLGVYPLQMLRLFVAFEGPLRARAARAAFMVLGKFAEAAGQIKFFRLRLSGRTAHLIEYK